MAYVNYEYYSNEYKGTLDEDAATKLLEESSDQIDRLTYGRIRCKGFDNLTEYQQELVKKAVCYQTDFINAYGAYLNMPISGYSAGGISLSFNKDNQGSGGIIVDKKTLDYLAQTGLASRRI